MDKSLNLSKQFKLSDLFKNNNKDQFLEIDHFDRVRLKSEQEKTAHIQKLAIGKISNIFV